mmetsp:Transcript_39540/g.51788  ORF Transcript_39540/g.51788 Transcript_39540/m.51788 type:complete len:192 (+) Transcript_39540:26-601(+)|eukprot:CAMPEP_0185601446 /NCGR_PEP_ID=MMETSP0436-20130131/1102_1 /TAXON_ID=626734 ORGANISM="Favella taraikaensis, Strain Fe Narragansett Bay" /NCGR_SAMPLE_ID=MMETSP0436 /ASSEMBLY_ACC=CAM_ASM_000390 /LENGTH=191 /DNA_ID=CAMNT_0028231379 /DNA_START=26 /DNA_END=601 /DNA_ORIENTATION=-
MINVEHNKQYSAGLLMMNCFWALVFGYFALRFDSDPETCEASDINDFRWGRASNFQREERFIDVGFRFRLTLTIAFASYAMMTVLGSLSYVITSDTIRKLLFFVLALVNYAVFFAWIFAFYVRVQHSGKVCSGDYLDSNDSREGFLIEQGRFIKIAIVCVLTLVTAAVTFVLCKIIRTPTQKPAETELERI